jgi:hypothetical protein
MTPEARGLWTDFLTPHASVLLYTADPGAHALGVELSVLLADGGRLQDWYAEGWSLTRRPQCKAADALPRNLHAGTSLLLGSQTNYARTHHFLRLARQSGARSIFVFDHWKNYAEHFQPDLLADQIVVPDETGRQALLAAIGPGHAGRVSVLAHLGIDAAVARIQAHALRLPGTVAVLLDPTEAADGLGYDWRSVLQEVAARAAALPAVNFLIKPHPRQQPDAVRAFIAGLGLSAARLRLVDMDTEQLIAAADEVWGMTTIALVSAFKAGKPIKSIQCGRNDKGRAASNHYLEPYLI